MYRNCWKLLIPKGLSRNESHPLRQIRPSVFNNSAWRSGFSWATAGNDAETHVDLRPRSPKNTRISATRVQTKVTWVHVEPAAASIRDCRLALIGGPDPRIARRVALKREVTFGLAVVAPARRRAGQPEPSPVAITARLGGLVQA